MKTQSENIITQICTNIFFKEFTFDKNEFYPTDGIKELADNVLWVDNLITVIQIKERKLEEIKSTEVENKWFQNTVLNKAKRQITDTIEYIKKYPEIKIKNLREHTFDISNIPIENIINYNLLSSK